MTGQINETSDYLRSATLSRVDRLREYLIYVAWSQALIATLGSLFLSEVMGFIPCNLCWYQRILMYPLVIIIGIGILLRDAKVRYYILPLSLLGLGIGLYHNLLYYGLIPETLQPCTSGVPCSTRWIEWFGFMGIPFAAFTAFTDITLTVIWHKPSDYDERNQTEAASQVSNQRLLNWTSAALIVMYIGIVAVGLASRVIENARPIDNSSGATADEFTVATSDAPVVLSATPYPENFILTGQRVYLSQCSACHGQNAQGVVNLGLPLVDTEFMRERSDDDLLEFIRTGRHPSDPQSQTGAMMPGSGGNPALTNTEILAVIAYLRSLAQ
jgi:disulfide bond formation protein DsbB